MVLESELVASARDGSRPAFEQLVAPYRRELKAHCYRMSGSLHDAEDLLQDALLKAWKAIGGFEGRASLRTWLYRVTTSVCLDAADAKKARVLPTGLGAAPTAAGTPVAPEHDLPWLEPAPEALIADTARSPEARYSARESVALAFLAALQLLPPKQRAVLILRDVLGWQASECADLLQLSVPAVNSALQRARDTLATRKERAEVVEDDSVRTLLARYVRVWEDADVPGLVQLLREDAVLSMPPFSAWFQGAASIGAAIGGMVLPPGTQGTFTLVAMRANGMPAFAMYARDAATGKRAPAAIHVLDVQQGKVAEITAFLDPRLFAAFGLPPSL